MPRNLDAQIVREWGRRYSNWGRWGPEEQLGTLNFITRERVLAACALPRTGRVISCALPFHGHGPTDLGDLPGTEPTGDFDTAADAVIMPWQCRTRWYPLAHVFYDGRAYNGREATLVTDEGALDRLKHGVVGRGVLLDVPHYMRIRWLENGRLILPEDLDACAEALGVTVESGDIVLVRTGMMTRCLEQESWEGFCGGPAPGLSVQCARWLFEREIAALATDTWGVEVLPGETSDCAHPLHMISSRDTGLLLGGIFSLDDLARACAEDGNYEFLFAAPPLPVTGTMESPVNPLAIK
jgi:kynurenine formamidase